MEQNKESTVDLGIFPLRQLTVMHSLADLGQLTASVIQRIRDLLVPIRPAVVELQKSGCEQDLLRMINQSVDQIEKLLALVVSQNELSSGGTAGAHPGMVLEQIADFLNLLRPNEVTVEKLVRWPEETRVSLSSSELQQILLRLCLDAVLAMPDGGWLQLRVTRLDSGDCRIIIQDSGPTLGREGVPETEPTGRRPDQGAIDLYLVRRLLKRHGGEISQERSGNRGTSIDLRLPTIQAPTPLVCAN